MPENSGTALEHPDMLYHEFVERAMNSHDPVTEIRPVGKGSRKVYSAAYYDPDAETCWRADIDHDPKFSDDARVSFSSCKPMSEHRTFRDWSPHATGRLSGPQKLPAWRKLALVFNAALEFFDEEYYG